MERRGNLVQMGFPEVFEAFSNLKGLKDRFDGSKSNGLGKKINGEMGKIKRIVLKQIGVDMSTLTDNTGLHHSEKIMLPRHLLKEISLINTNIRIIRNQRGEKQACLR
jgi:hypothetical protein